MAEPLTLQQLLDQLAEMVRTTPDILGWPVHLLDNSPEDDTPTCGLVTTVEIDCFDLPQGNVVSLVAGEYL